jgi:hypothetical protein
VSELWASIPSNEDTGGPWGRLVLLGSLCGKASSPEMATADYILRQETLVTPDHDLLPIVTKCLATVGRLTDLLQTLGLERKTKDVPDLDTYLVELEQEKQREAEAASVKAEEQVEEERTDGADERD